jgi:hypothetical protein
MSAAQRVDGDRRQNSAVRSRQHRKQRHPTGRRVREAVEDAWLRIDQYWPFARQLATAFARLSLDPPPEFG